MPLPDQDGRMDENDIRPTCYEIVIPDDDDIPNTESSPAELNPDPEPQSSVEDSDAALEEVQQYYEKVKRESPVNNVDNAETKDEPTKWVLPHCIYLGINPIISLIDL